VDVDFIRAGKRQSAIGRVCGVVDKERVAVSIARGDTFDFENEDVGDRCRAVKSVHMDFDAPELDAAKIADHVLADNGRGSAGFAPDKVVVHGTQRATAAEGDGKFESGERTWSKKELLDAVQSEPENFSPNALFRPVVQDFLLPTAAYIGGPAEISYFAQSEVLYRQLLGRMPVMLPRPGFTLLDAKAQRLLQQYGIEVEEVWGGPQELLKRMSAASIPESLSTLLEDNGAEIHKRLRQWSDAIAVLDPTLKTAVETAQSKIEYQTEKLQQMIGRALDRKSGTVASHQEFLSNLIYPNKSLQSRELSFLPFAARWGQAAFEEIERHSGLKNAGTHFIIPTP